MGEVYRARDTRLSRNVALKFLRGAVRDDSRLRARFEREARAISSLSDPHICALYDVGSHDGLEYLVLEYCDGVTLAERLDGGPLPIKQVLQHGRAIAKALSRAHRAGIVHRDLKPSNVMLTKSGVKLLDFGLAKPGIGRSRHDTETTSLHEPISEEGSLIGTVRYMSPEVLEGREPDARSDIFALGVVLYEMLTGKPAFSGTSTPSIMASILEREPQPIRELQPQTPPALEHVIAKALAKNPEERWESAHDIAEELRWISESADVPSPSKKRRYVPIAVAGATLLLVLAAAAAMMLRARPREADQVIRLSIPLRQPSDAALSNTAKPVLTGGDLSRDGRRVAFSYCAPCDSHGTNSRIYVREIDSFATVPVAGTEGGQSPFFSPDGLSIGFFVMGQFRKIPITGGTPQTITNQTYWLTRGIWWAPDGTIYFAPGLNNGLWSVPAAGGEPREVTKPDAAQGENSHRWPQVLPEGEHVLFTVRTTQISSFDQARLAVLSLKTGRWKVVLEGGTFGRYTSGQLIFARAGALYGVPFDLASMSVQGTPRKVLDGVSTGKSSGNGGYAVSDDGDLMFLAGGAGEQRTDILAVDRTGNSRVLGTVGMAASRPRLSPDGRRVAFSVSAANEEIWLFDFESGIASIVTARPGEEMNPIWTPDGTRLIYMSSKITVSQRLDVSAEVEELLRPSAGNPTAPWMTSCAPDSKTILYSENHPETKSDLWILPLEGDRTPRPLLRSPAAEYAAQFSPDGKWIAYVAAETDRAEVYVRPRAGTERFQVSRGGGNPPVWSHDGKEIYYLLGDQMIGVPIAVEGSTIRPGKPRALFSFPSSSFFDVTKDGFLMLRLLDPPEFRELNVVLNWRRELLR